MDTFIQKIIRQGKVRIPPMVSYNITFNQSFYPTMSYTLYDKENGIYLRGDNNIVIEGSCLNAVIWMNGYISLYHTPKNQDFISFDFDGCVMASFDIGNEHYAAHIQRGENDRTQDWINFLTKRRRDIKNLVMFRPNFQRLRKVRQRLTTPNNAWLWGLITPDRNCYSICVSGEENEQANFSSQNEFSLEFIERHLTPFHLGAYDKIIQPVGEPVAAWNNFFELMPVRKMYPARAVNIESRNDTSRKLNISCC